MDQAVEMPPAFDDMSASVTTAFEGTKAGDVDGAFAQAYRVVKQRIVSQRLAAMPMEARAVVAAPDPASGGLTCGAAPRLRTASAAIWRPRSRCRRT